MMGNGAVSSRSSRLLGGAAISVGGLFGAAVMAMGLVAGPAAAKVTPVKASTPTVMHAEPRVWMDSGLPFAPYAALEVIEAGGVPVPVVETPASAASNPEGIAVIRGGNHAIPRVAPGKGLTLLEVAGDAAGSVFVWYTAPNGGGGHDPHLRRVNAANQSAFDVKLLIERQAGVAADGGGGAYVASHRFVAKDGEFYVSMTEHRTYRLSPTGATLWERAEAAEERPAVSSDHRTVAAPTADGVLVGYAVRHGDAIEPVILQRRADDGALIFKRGDLVVAGGDGSSGALGRTPLRGRVAFLEGAADRTTIAAITDKYGVKTLVHLGVDGQQRAAYRCDGGVHRIAQGDVYCGKQIAGGLQITRYGLLSGALKAKGAFTFSAPAGWTITAHAGAPSGQLMVAGQKNGAVTLALLSSGGATLATYAQGVPGKIDRLHVDDSYTWVGYGQVGDDFRRFSGPWSPGTSTAKVKLLGP